MNPAEKTLRENPNPVKLTPEEKVKFFTGLTKTNSCWIWNKVYQGQPYGQFYYRGKVYRSNRFSWMIHFGDIPDGLWVLHNCPNGDNPSCVNPDHLWLGTSGENSLDMVAKGRAVYPSGNQNGMTTCPESVLRGSKSPNAKLNETIVAELFMMFRNGRLGIIKETAERLGVSQTVIGSIIHGRSWNHVTGLPKFKSKPRIR